MAHLSSTPLSVSLFRKKSIVPVGKHRVFSHPLARRSRDDTVAFLASSKNWNDFIKRAVESVDDHPLLFSLHRSQVLCSFSPCFVLHLITTNMCGNPSRKAFDFFMSLPGDPAVWLIQDFVNRNYRSVLTEMQCRSIFVHNVSDLDLPLRRDVRYLSHINVHRSRSFFGGFALPINPRSFGVGSVASVVSAQSNKLFDILSTAIRRLWEAMRSFGGVGSLMLGLYVIRWVLKRPHILRVLLTSMGMASLFLSFVASKIPKDVYVTLRDMFEDFSGFHHSLAALVFNTASKSFHQPGGTIIVEPQAAPLSCAKAAFVALSLAFIGRKVPIWMKLASVSKVGPVLESLFEGGVSGFTDCVNFLGRFFTKDKRDLIVKHASHLRTLEIRFSELQRKLSTAHVASGPSEFRDYTTLYSDVGTELKSWPRTSPEYRSLRDLESRLAGLSRHFNSLQHLGRGRPQPLGIWLNGAPGCGKTILANTISRHLYGLMYPNAIPYDDLPSALQNFAVDPSVEHFDGYNPGVFSMTFDDFLQNKLDINSSGVVQALITAVNGEPRAFCAATCEDKGKLSANHALTIVTTNIRAVEIGLRKVMEDVYALERRFPLAYTVTLKHASHDLAQALKGDIDDVWSFTPICIITGKVAGNSITYTEVLSLAYTTQMKLASDFQLLKGNGALPIPAAVYARLGMVQPQGAFMSVGKGVVSVGKVVGYSAVAAATAGKVGVDVATGVFRRKLKNITPEMRKYLLSVTASSVLSLAQILAMRTLLKAALRTVGSLFGFGRPKHPSTCSAPASNSTESSFIPVHVLAQASEKYRSAPYSKDPYIASIQRNIRIIFDEGAPVGFGFCVNDRNITFPAHFLGTSVKTKKLHVSLDLGHGTVLKPLEVVHVNWGGDLAIAIAPKLNAPDRTGSLSSSPSNLVHDVLVVPFRGECITGTCNGTRRAVLYGGDDNATMQKVVVMPYATRHGNLGQGSCGLPVISSAHKEGGRRIEGFHVAYDPSNCSSFFATSIDPSYFGSSVGKADPQSGLLRVSNPPVWLKEVQPKYVNTHNNLITNPYKDRLGVCDDVPVFADEHWLERTARDYNLSSPIEVPAFTKVASLTSKYLFESLPKSVNKVVTFEEAVYGCADINLSPVNMNSSPGYPLSLKYATKRDVVGTRESPGPGLTALLEQVCDWETGRQPAVYSLFPKVESRHPSKSDPRPVQASPFGMTVAIRRRFGPVVAKIVENRHASGIMIGFAPNKESNHLSARFGGLSAPVCAGDLKQQDRSQQHHAQMAIGNAWCDQVDDGSSEFKLFRENFLRDYAQFTVLTGSGNFASYLVRYFGSMPSGHPLTSFLNSFYTVSLLAYACYRKNGDSTASVIDFLNREPRAIYGDDFIYGVSRPSSPDLFDLVKFSAEVGMRVTDDKGMIPTVGSVPLCDTTFLARSWVVDPANGFVSLALSMESIFGMFAYRKPSTPMATHLRGVCESALMELAGHGTAIFGEFLPKIVELVDQYGVIVTGLIPYDNAYEYWRHKYENSVPEWNLWIDSE